MLLKHIRSTVAGALLVVSSPCWAQAFFMPDEKDRDAGSYLELDWATGISKSADMRLSTGEQSAVLEGPATVLDWNDKESRDLLKKVFADADLAKARAECRLTMLLVLCRSVKGLHIAARQTQGSSSPAFQAKEDFVICIDGLAGSGACMDTKPIPKRSLKS